MKYSPLPFYFNNSVETATIGALHTQKVPRQVRTLDLTIIAHDIHRPRQIFRHRLALNIRCSFCPCRCHGSLTHNRLFTNGTPIIKSRQLPETVRVNCMSTGQILRGVPGGVHILPADGTVVLILIPQTIVRLECFVVDTHGTLVAMAKFVCSSNSTKSAFVTVEGPILRLHPQIAAVTVILGKRDVTLDTLIRARLAGIAFFANNLLHVEAVHLPMGQIREFIVTYAATVGFAAARSDEVALSLVVDAGNGTTCRNSHLKRLDVVLADFTVRSCLLKFVVMFLL